MSDVRTITQLILYRSRLDGAHAALQETQSLMNATEIATMYEPVFLTYVDLDTLIEQCNLASMQRRIIADLMLGYTITDCAERYDCPKQAIATHLHRAAGKIAQQNELNWAKVYGK